MRRAIHQNVREFGNSVLPSVRLVALVYTGLGGFAALFLVLAAALMPRSPIIEQVTEPAREVVASFVVQPTSDLVTGLMIPPPIVVVPQPAPTPAPFVATISLDITIDEDAPAPIAPPPAIPAPAQRVTHYVAPPAPVVEEQPAEDELQPEEISDAPAPLATELVVVSSPPEMHAASAEPPKPLPTPVPTLTPAQLKAQKDAENEEAIAANKAAQAQAKAATDAANQAAIQANTVPLQADDKAMADASLALPILKASAAPKVASASTKAAAAASKAQADAGNQAAIDAAKAAKATSQAAAAAAAKAAKR